MAEADGEDYTGTSATVELQGSVQRLTESTCNQQVLFDTLNWRRELNNIVFVKECYEFFHLATKDSLFHIVFFQHSTDDVRNFVAFLN